MRSPSKDPDAYRPAPWAWPRRLRASAARLRAAVPAPPAWARRLLARIGLAGWFAPLRRLAGRHRTAATALYFATALAALSVWWATHAPVAWAAWTACLVLRPAIIPGAEHDGAPGGGPSKAPDDYL